jgi:hypothetical protein
MQWNVNLNLYELILKFKRASFCNFFDAITENKPHLFFALFFIKGEKQR